jgi:DNA/RNA-binding protein KIN17
MCAKQCRDANGFKCHLTSESHLRQMKIFSDHATSYMDQYSKEFEKSFIDTLRMRHSTCKVAANVVYQEVIHDRSHVHMNATIWATLTDFCKYLGKTGQCVVEETERGWYLTYIERNATKLLQVEMTQRRLEAEQAAELAANERIEQQRIAAAIALDRAASAPGAVVGDSMTTNKMNSSYTGPTNLQRDDMSDSTNMIHLALNTKKSFGKKKKFTPVSTSVFDNDDDDDDDDGNKDSETQSTVVNSNAGMKHTPLSDQQQNWPKPKQALNMSIGQAERHHHNDVKTSAGTASEVPVNNSNDESPWLYSNLLVRIINESLGDGQYFRRKGVIAKVVDDYVAKVQVQDDDDDPSNFNGDMLQLDQDDLETVAPKRIRETIRMVRGKYRGMYGTVLELDKKKYLANIEAQITCKDGSMSTKVLSRVNYNDFSKVRDL